MKGPTVPASFAKDFLITSFFQEVLPYLRRVLIGDLGQNVHQPTAQLAAPSKRLHRALIKVAFWVGKKNGQLCPRQHLLGLLPIGAFDSVEVRHVGQYERQRICPRFHGGEKDSPVSLRLLSHFFRVSKRHHPPIGKYKLQHIGLGKTLGNGHNRMIGHGADDLSCGNIDSC